MSRVAVPSIEGKGGIVTDGFGYIDGSGAGFAMQEIYAENQVRPTILTEPAPGNLFFTILTVPITTTTGPFIEVNAQLCGVIDGGAGSTYVDGGIRILIDGVSTGLGSFQTTPQTLAQPYCSISIITRTPVVAGVHSVELQWCVGADGAADKLFGFLNADFDGCSMLVREIR